MVWGSYTPEPNKVPPPPPRLDCMKCSLYSRETLAVARAFGNCGRMFYCRGCRAKEIAEGNGTGAAGTEKLRSQRPAVEVRNESPDGGAQGRNGGQSSGAPKNREAVAAPVPDSSGELTSRAADGGRPRFYGAALNRDADVSVEEPHVDPESADRLRPGTGYARLRHAGGAETARPETGEGKSTAAPPPEATRFECAECGWSGVDGALPATMVRYGRCPDCGATDVRVCP